MDQNCLTTGNQPRTATDPQDVTSRDAGLPLRILVIEDNVDLADTLCSLLEILGHQAEAAHDGKAGIDRFFTFLPQVVFCDIGLPGRNGYEVAQAVRSDPRGCAARLIALSGYAQADDIDRALAAGFNRHLPKPVSIEMLREALAPTPDADCEGRPRNADA